jgi:hypothetical protein
MEYLIAAAASVWLVAFMLAEHRAGGRTGHLRRLVGAAPLVVLVVLAWIRLFSYDALMIVIATVVVSTTVESIVRWYQRRSQTKGNAG